MLFFRQEIKRRDPVRQPTCRVAPRRVHRAGRARIGRAAAHQNPGRILAHPHRVLFGSMRAVPHRDRILVGHRSACIPRSTTSWIRWGPSTNLDCVPLALPVFSSTQEDTGKASGTPVAPGTAAPPLVAAEGRTAFLFRRKSFQRRGREGAEVRRERYGLGVGLVTPPKRLPKSAGSGDPRTAWE